MNPLQDYVPPTDPRLTQTEPSRPESAFAAAWDKYIPRDKALVYSLDYQYPVADFYLDFAHPEAKVCVEIDGKEWHSDPDAILRDLKRETRLAHEGWQVIRLSYWQVTLQPMWCVMRVRAAIRVALGLPYDGPAQRKYPIV